jgi:hypothetical protein
MPGQQNVGREEERPFLEGLKRQLEELWDTVEDRLEELGRQEQPGQGQAGGAGGPGGPGGPRGQAGRRRGQQ